jgi:L-ascorbate metabolism protein UlaG (beta-lactamase superfamily)
MQVTYLGHSCFQLLINGKSIVFDPFIRPNELAINAGVVIDEIQADYILVSHAHDDHTADLVYLANNTNALVVSSWEICSWLNKQGIKNTHPMNVGGGWTFDFGRIDMVHAAHSSSFSDGTYGGVASGFVIESAGKSIYYAGDTGLNMEMKILGEKYHIDAALLPIGDNFTMGYKDALLCAQYVNAKQVIAMHFDTFGFIKIDHKVVQDYFNESNKKLTIPKIKQTITI